MPLLQTYCYTTLYGMFCCCLHAKFKALYAAVAFLLGTDAKRCVLLFHFSWGLLCGVKGMGLLDSDTPTPLHSRSVLG